MNASMISLRWVLVATSVVLFACGADDSDTDDEPSGGTPAALPDGASPNGIGGQSTTGGAPATGGGAVATGGAPSSGGSESNATGGATGGSSTTGGSIVQRATRVCQNDQSAGYVLGCMAVYEATYVTDCIEAWNAAGDVCSAQTGALLDCWLGREVLDYDCDADGRVVLSSGICATEATALDVCQVGS
jgi:hypothetical protein